MAGGWPEVLLNAVVIGALVASIVLGLINSRTARLLSAWMRPDRS